MNFTFKVRVTYIWDNLVFIKRW